MSLPTKLAEFIGSLTCTQGDGEGEPFRVLPWQSRFLQGAFSKPEGMSALTLARGNGKTSIIATIACAALVGPLMRRRAETVVVASSFEQSRICFDHALAMMREAGHDVDDKRVWKLNDHAHKAQLEHRQTGARLRCIGSDPARAHGIAPVLAICDEPAQWPANTSHRMFAALRTSLGKIQGGRLIALGTRPDNDDHWFEALLRNPLAFGLRYQATEEQREKRPFHLATIKAANPSWDHLPTLQRTVLRERDEAKTDPQLAAQFRALRLNGGVADTETLQLIEAADWARMEKRNGEKAGPCVYGVDLAGGAAMSALAAYWPTTGRLEAFAAFPSKPDLADREKRDGVGNLYSRMLERGELFLCGEHAVDLREFFAVAMDRYGSPACITADRWKEADLLQGLENASVPRCPWVPRGQGFKDGSEDVRFFRRACSEGWVVPVQSLLLRSAMREAKLVSDPARNQKIAKKGEGGRRQHSRDDAACAAVLAIAEGYREAKRRNWRVPQ